MYVAIVKENIFAKLIKSIQEYGIFPPTLPIKLSYQTSRIMPCHKLVQFTM